jgi:hypothetical protein
MLCHFEMPSWYQAAATFWHPQNPKNLNKKIYARLTDEFLILKLPFLLNNSSELKRLDSFEFQRFILRLR